jgi:hypothetical protein
MLLSNKKASFEAFLLLVILFHYQLKRLLQEPAHLSKLATTLPEY